MAPWPGPIGKLPVHVLEVSLQTGKEEGIREPFPDILVCNTLASGYGSDEHVHPVSSSCWRSKEILVSMVF